MVYSKQLQHTLTSEVLCKFCAILLVCALAQLSAVRCAE
jgi:hypothetical protein